MRKPEDRERLYRIIRRWRNRNIRPTAEYIAKERAERATSDRT